MEDRRDHRIQIALCSLLACVLIAAAGPALADDSNNDPPFNWDPTIVVDTGPDSVVVDSTVEGQDEGVSGSGNQASGSGPHCYLKEIPGSEMTEDLTLEYWARRMRYSPYYLICDGENRGIVWIEITLDEPGGSGGAASDPRDIAMHLRNEMPIPRATVDINPGEGVVGVESWFWLQGYDGAPVTDSTNAFGRFVEVEARVTHYEWSFGDGVTTISDTRGEAYPSRSEIRHVYQRSSAGMPDGYSVDVTFEFTVRYRVDGGPWIEIPGITREGHADYPVRESQAVIER